MPRPPRLEAVPPERLDAAQRRVWDRIAAGPRGEVRGPFHAWLRSPELAGRIERTATFLRYETSLPPRLSELAVLVTARFWGARYAWDVHAPLARGGGLAPEVIAGLAAGGRPAAMRPDEAALYDYATALHERHFVGDAAYEAALAHFGEAGLVELTALLGHYTMVAMTLNAFGPGAPGGGVPGGGAPPRPE